MYILSSSLSQALQDSYFYDDPVPASASELLWLQSNIVHRKRSLKSARHVMSRKDIDRLFAVG
jgi:hypothetical protein